jgi:hypothetical protein
MDVLIVGGDPAVQEGVLQSIRAAGLSAEVCPDLSCARDSLEEVSPLALVVHETLASAVSELRHSAPSASSAVILFRDGTGTRTPFTQSFGRSVIAELTLPLERARLVALLTHIVMRARQTGRDKRSPEPPINP